VASLKRKFSRCAKFRQEKKKEKRKNLKLYIAPSFLLETKFLQNKKYTDKREYSISILNFFWEKNSPILGGKKFPIFFPTFGL